MNRIFIISILVALFTPIICFGGDIAEHQINVPKEYSWGRSQEAFEGTSPIERYVQAYERTWWKVMNAFAYNETNWQRHDSFICSGTPAEAQACIDAYDAATDKIRAWVKTVGENETKELLKKRLNKQ